MDYFTFYLTFLYKQFHVYYLIVQDVPYHIHFNSNYHWTE